MDRLNPECTKCGRCFLPENILDHVTLHHEVPLDHVWYGQNENQEPEYHIISLEWAKAGGLVK